jgi:hypothetical protein
VVAKLCCFYSTHCASIRAVRGLPTRNDPCIVPDLGLELATCRETAAAARLSLVEALVSLDDNGTIVFLEGSWDDFWKVARQSGANVAFLDIEEFDLSLAVREDATAAFRPGGQASSSPTLDESEIAQICHTLPAGIKRLDGQAVGFHVTWFQHGVAHQAERELEGVAAARQRIWTVVRDLLDKKDQREAQRVGELADQLLSNTRWHLLKRIPLKEALCRTMFPSEPPDIIERIVSLARQMEELSLADALAEAVSQPDD